jgi:hypothetical protein
LAGVRAVNRVELTKVTPTAGVPPIRMDAPETKPVPDTVIVVPPPVGPLSGDTDVAVSDDAGGVPGTLYDTWADGALVWPDVL